MSFTTFLLAKTTVCRTNLLKKAYNALPISKGSCKEGGVISTVVHSKHYNNAVFCENGTRQ